MSSSDRAAARPRRLMIAGLLAALATTAGCTVQPLYGETTSAIGSPVIDSARLASVDVAPAKDRVGQEVRNHLIFLLSGGKGQPANPAYRLELNTVALASSGPTVETKGNTLEPSSGIMTVRGAYRLSESGTGTLVSSGVRSVQAAYDIPAQRFAALRAKQNAEDRAARELAEILRLVVAQELQRSTSTSVPHVISSPEELEARERPGEPASF